MWLWPLPQLPLWCCGTLAWVTPFWLSVWGGCVPAWQGALSKIVISSNCHWQLLATPSLIWVPPPPNLWLSGPPLGPEPTQPPIYPIPCPSCRRFHIFPLSWRSCWVPGEIAVAQTPLSPSRALPNSSLPPPQAKQHPTTLFKTVYFIYFFFVRQTHWFLDHSRGWKPFTNLFIWKYKYKIILSTSVMWETAIHIVIFYNRALRKPHTKTWKMLEIYI